jgi:hypothetical protein
VLPRAGAAVFQRSAFPARSFALGVAAGDYNTPGFEPTVGTKIPGKIGVQKARSWDDAVGDSFKATHTSEIFGNGKVRPRCALGEDTPWYAAAAPPPG